MAFAAGARIGAYEVVSRIGAGGMGEVYRAADTNLKRQVAIKVLTGAVATDADRLARFQREAQVLAALNHPNIAQIYSLDNNDGATALIMELVEGPTLEDRIVEGPIAPDEALAIATQISRALEAAHEEGIIHRDLKPSNIKVRDDGMVKVLDFGLAKAMEPPRDASSLSQSPTITSPAMTRAGVVLGTAAYMSPEQWRGREVDKRTDIWAFGCVLYEMLSGKQAFPGDDGAEIAASVLAKEPDWNALPANVRPALRVFLRRCLRKDPRERVRDMGDVRLAIEGAFDVTPGISADHGSRGRRSRIQLMTVGAVMLAAAAAFTGWWFASSGADSRTISFVLHPPKGTAFTAPQMEPYPSLSPDGLYLAFRAPLRSTMVIWIQSLGDLEARPLSGTEGGAHPFWSPDGRSIGFTSLGRLMKIAAFGGSAPQELCVCSSQWGGAWNPDGTIVFATSTGGLFQISSNGGQVSPVTRLDESAGEFSHRFPRFLPGGRRFVYLVRSTKAEERGVHLGSLDDPALKRRLVPDDANAGYGIGPDGQGYLFFVRDLMLLAQPFDVERGELTRSPQVMARPVLPGQGGRLAPFAVERRTLVYLQREEAVNRLVWVNRSGVPESTLGLPGADYSNLSLSPDGKLVAAGLRDPRSGKQDIWLLETRRPTSDRLTTDLLGAEYPVWLPDGSRIVYASAREGQWSLYSRSTSGSGGEELLSRVQTNTTKRPRDVTPDGQFVLFQNDQDLWALPLVGERQPFLLMPEAYEGRVSPDGRWLAYTIGTEGQTAGYADSERPSEASQLYVTTFPKPTQRWRISTTSGQDPQWSADGRELFYIAGQTLMSVAVRAVTTFDYETPKPLFRISFNPRARTFGSTYAPALDRQRFLVNESLKEEQRLLGVTINWTRERQE